MSSRLADVMAGSTRARGPTVFVSSLRISGMATKKRQQETRGSTHGGSDRPGGQRTLRHRPWAAELPSRATGYAP